MSDTARKLWSAGAHERKVENLYSGGVENFADWHNGYLNFGLWENGNTDYIKAAENLVHRLGDILGLNETSKLLVRGGRHVAQRSGIAPHQASPSGGGGIPARVQLDEHGELDEPRSAAQG